MFHKVFSYCPAWEWDFHPIPLQDNRFLSNSKHPWRKPTTREPWWLNPFPMPSPVSKSKFQDQEEARSPRKVPPWKSPSSPRRPSPRRPSPRPRQPRPRPRPLLRPLLRLHLSKKPKPL